VDAFDRCKMYRQRAVLAMEIARVRQRTFGRFFAYMATQMALENIYKKSRVI